MVYVIDKWACQACLNDGVCVEDLVTSPPSSLKSGGDGTQDAVFSEPKASTGVSRQQSRVSGELERLRR